MTDEQGVLACVRLTSPLMMPDNEIGLCDGCGEAIQFRPHVPKELRKLCIECVTDELADAGEVTLAITPETIAELRDHRRKKAH